MTPSYKASPGDDESILKAARERAEAIQGLYIHLLVFVVINACLFGINWLTRGDSGAWWFYWPLLGWGVGLVAHGFSVFGLRGMFGPDWEDKRIREIVEKERKRESRP